MVKVHPPPMRVPIVDVKTGNPTLAFYDHMERMWMRSGGAGDINISSAPASSTDNALARYTGTIGNLQDSGVLLDDSNNFTGIASISGLTTDLAIAEGGTGSSTASAARTALGVGTGDSPTFTGLTLSANHTNSGQPAFRVNTNLVSNVTGDSTTYTVVYANEVFDQGSDFDGTSTFTAPITGRYLLTLIISASGLDGTSDKVEIQLMTSNDAYVFTQNETNMPQALMTPTLSVVADMDASDTATTTLQVVGDNKVVDIGAGSGHFSGILLA